MPSVCPECEALNPIENLHCNKCGAPMRGEHSLTPEQQPAQPAGFRLLGIKWGQLGLGALVAVLVCWVATPAMIGVMDTLTNGRALPALGPKEPPPAVQIYALELEEKVSAIGEALGKVSVLTSEPRLLDENWMLDVTAQAVRIRVTHHELVNMDVPTEMAEIHRVIVDGTQDCSDAMDYVAQGIDYLDEGDLNQGAVLILRCGEKLDTAATMVLDYMSQYE